jgi:hypothetical protein
VFTWITMQRQERKPRLRSTSARGRLESEFWGVWEFGEFGSAFVGSRIKFLVSPETAFLLELPRTKQTPQTPQSKMIGKSKKSM